MSAAFDNAMHDAFERLQKEMLRPPFHSVLAPEAHEVNLETGEVVVHLPFRPEFAMDSLTRNYHGGVIAALIDLAGHAAVAVKIGRHAPTIDMRIDFLRRAPDVTLWARARVLQAGRSIARADIEVAAGDTIVAVGRGTFSTT